MIKRALIHRVSQLAVLGLVLWLGWTTLIKSKPLLADGPRRATEDMSARLGPRLIAALPAGATLTLLPLAGDQTGAIGESIRSTLLGYGTIALLPPSFGERLGDAIGTRRQGVDSVAAAIVRGRDRGASHVLFGIASSVVSGGTVQLALDLHLIDVANQRELDVAGADASAESSLLPQPGAGAGGPSDSFGWRLTASTGVDAAGAGELSPGWLAWARGLGLWALAAMSLPVLSIGFLRVTASRESNAANALLLGGYLLASAILYLLLVGLELRSVWSWGFAAVAMLACGAYQFLVMSRVAKSAELT